jgi:arsenate reductase-like glutaredoxin family protein
MIFRNSLYYKELKDILNHIKKCVKCHKLTERYVQYALNFFCKYYKKILTKNNVGYIVYKHFKCGKTVKGFLNEKEQIFCSRNVGNGADIRFRSVGMRYC